MQAIFGKDFKGGIKLRSYCKEHSPNINLDEGQADKIDASGVKEIDMTNLADDRLLEGHEELDYFWKYVDINEVHRNISEAYARAERIKLASINDGSDIEPATPKKKSKKQPNGKADESGKRIKSKLAESIIKQKGALTEFQEVDPFVLDLIYRYWMLLRTANNGQSLIKFSPSALREREFEQRKSILKLRIELERVRNLSYMIGRREKLKLNWLKAHQDIIRRTLGLINDLDPPQDDEILDDRLNNPASIAQTSILSAPPHHSAAIIGGQPSSVKKSLQPSQHLQTTNNMIDESNQLINDLIFCDQIYEVPSDSCPNTNYSNLTYQERSTLERRRTLSLVRRINRQLKKVGKESPLNPYAKNYISKRSGSPFAVGQQSTTITKVLRSK